MAKLLKPPYYKIRCKQVSDGSLIDDFNNPDPADSFKTKRFKTLQAAKKAFGKTTWGIPHTKMIVKVSRSGTTTVYKSDRVFPRGAKKPAKKPRRKTAKPQRKSAPRPKRPRSGRSAGFDFIFG